MRPVVILRNPDTRVARGAWQDYEPGLPTTPAGLVWAALDSSSSAASSRCFANRAESCGEGGLSDRRTD